MGGNIKLLDCTLRDGGQGLEDSCKNGMAVERFTEDDKKKIIECLQDSGVDIIELGCVDEGSRGQEGFCIYENLEKLSEHMPRRRKKNQLFTGLYVGPDTKLEKIPQHSPEQVEAVRVIMRYSELQKSIEFCKGLSQKGYKVFVQPMLTMRYADEELDRLIYAANEMKAYALYIVDSFGYMEEKDLDRLFGFYDSRLDADIYVGFHAHNNMNMAYGNVRFFLESFKHRKLIVDSCVCGMGQGAGNMQTELLVKYMNDHCQKKYSLGDILQACEVLDRFGGNDMRTWGYAPLRMIPAIHKTAYKYAVALRLQHGLSYARINEILEAMPDELRHRYTPENLRRIIQ